MLPCIVEEGEEAQESWQGTSKLKLCNCDTTIPGDKNEKDPPWEPKTIALGKRGFSSSVPLTQDTIEQNNYDSLKASEQMPLHYEKPTRT